MSFFTNYRVAFLWILSGVLAQFIKFFTFYFRKKRIDLRLLIEPGGMPSSHASAVSTLSTSIGLTEGFNSALFAAVLLFSFIIVYEATGLRRVVGEQAEALNRLIKAIHKKEEVPTQELRVLLGHTPLEVLLGIAMGVFFALAFT
jgi:hypothetical protein